MLSNDTILTLETSDGGIVKIPVRAAKNCELICIAFDLMNNDEEDDDDDNDNNNNDDNENNIIKKNDDFSIDKNPTNDDNKDDQNSHDNKSHDHCCHLDIKKDNDEERIKTQQQQQLVQDNQQQEEQQSVLDVLPSLSMHVPNTDQLTLQKVIDFLIYYEKKPFQPLENVFDTTGSTGSSSGNGCAGKKQQPMNREPTFTDFIQDQWYERFMEELEQTTTTMNHTNTNNKPLIFSIKSVAHYMNVHPLSSMICLWQALTINRLQNVEAIRKYLHIPELTKEEEEQARKEHPWLFR